MSPHSRDLTIDSALADPLIRAVMRADRVDPRAFETLLRRAARAVAAEAPRAPAALMAAKNCGALARACFA